MSQVDAIYQNGVFKPLGEVNVAENQRVHLTIEPLPAQNVAEWLEGVRQLQERIVAERGYFPDSTQDIAADRAR